jgi:hypothetical protein
MAAGAGDGQEYELATGKAALALEAAFTALDASSLGILDAMYRILTPQMKVAA